MDIEKTLDAKGLACPMPIVRTKKAIEGLDSGRIMEVVTTDSGSKSDMTAWCKSSGNELLELNEDDGVYTFLIRKA